jgi:GT2 family glycosyltransferase
VLAVSDSGKPTIEYVVVAFNSARHITACLDAIEADRPTGSGITVVDNASRDDSVALAAGHSSMPRVVSSPDNVGFGAGCNLGVEGTSAQFVFFVNPDARLRPGVTTGLVEPLVADATIAAIGPRVIGDSGPAGAASAGFEPSIRSALGHFLLLARLPLLRTLFPPLQLPPNDATRRVDWVSGAAMAVRAADFRRVGGFDQSMFLYMEDVDLCRRLREAGGGVVYEPSVEVVHDLGGSQGNEQPARWYRAFHSYVARRHGGGYARFVSSIAAVGLGMRAVVLSATDMRRAKRLGRAALTAAYEAGRMGNALPERRT